MGGVESGLGGVGASPLSPAAQRSLEAYARPPHLHRRAAHLLEQLLVLVAARLDLGGPQTSETVGAGRGRWEQVGEGGRWWEKVGEGEGGGGGRRCEGREVAGDRARWREVAGDRARSREIGRGRLLEADDEAGVAVDEAARPLVAQQHHLLEIVRDRARSCEVRAEIVRDAWRTCAPSLSCSEGGTRHAALPSPKNCEIEARSRGDSARRGETRRDATRRGEMRRGEAR